MGKNVSHSRVLFEKVILENNEHHLRFVKSIWNTRMTETITKDFVYIGKPYPYTKREFTPVFKRLVAEKFPTANIQYDGGVIKLNYTKWLAVLADARDKKITITQEPTQEDASSLALALELEMELE